MRNTITLSLLLETKVKFVFPVPQLQSLRTQIEVIHCKTGVLCRDVSKRQGQWVMNISTVNISEMATESENTLTYFNGQRRGHSHLDFEYL